MGDQPGRRPLAFGDARGGDLDPVDLDLAQQQARQLELFFGAVGHIGRLLAIAQGGVHDCDMPKLIVCLVGVAHCLPLNSRANPDRRSIRPRNDEAAGCWNPAACSVPLS